VRSFFDPTLVEKWGAAFIREDKIEESLARLIPKVYVTKGRFSYPSRSEQRDLVWNHMDQNHRPLIHRTYGDAMRVFVGQQAAFSLTRFGNWPLVIPVFDGYHKENGFYQVMCLFGLIVVICIIECNADERGTRMDIDWAIASHRWLRFLHPALNRRLMRLNGMQNREDDEIRDRRIELRAAGYRFATDAPDFVNCNVMANNVVYPPLATSQSISLADFPEGALQRVEVADRTFLLRRQAGAVEIWPGVCPHEGAPLNAVDLRGSMLKCPWHGLEFGPRRLLSGGASATVCGARLELSGTKLSIGPALEPNIVE